MIKEIIDCGEQHPETIIDCTCEVNNITCKNRSIEELVISGQASYILLAMDKDEVPFCVEKVQPFEIVAQISGLDENSVLDPYIQVQSVTYNMSREGEIDIRVTVSLDGCLYQTQVVNIIKEINIDKDSPKEKSDEYGLKLYFADEGEDVWGIAKRYNTDCNAIIAENELESEKVSSGMLLIPIV